MTTPDRVAATDQFNAQLGDTIDAAEEFIAAWWDEGLGSEQRQALASAALYTRMNELHKMLMEQRS